MDVFCIYNSCHIRNLVIATMHDSLNIRFAEAGDIAALCELLGLLFTQEKEFCADPEAQRRGLEQIIRQRHTGRIMIACLDDTVVAMINMLFTVSTALGKPVVMLEDMVVAPAHRQSGIGSTLLQSAIDYAQQQGYARLTLLTDDDNTIAQAFYHKHGFRQPAMIPMQRILQAIDDDAVA